MQPAGGRLVGGRADAAARRRATRSPSTAASRAPTRARSRCPTGATGRARSSTTQRSPGPTTPGAASQLPGAVIYELHVGTFTPEGTLDAAIERLDHLVDLGVDIVELMPVATFPGRHGWGYDGVDLYAVHEPYGGPDGAAALRRRLPRAAASASCLDVVYNHLGPAGNYLGEFGPYFTDRYATPWGAGASTSTAPAATRCARFVSTTRCMWLRDFHVDGLRLDAVHALVDDSRACTCSRSWPREVDALAGAARPAAVPDRRVRPQRPAHGHRRARPAASGCDAQWADDFHHALHVAAHRRDAGLLRRLRRPRARWPRCCARAFFHDGTLLDASAAARTAGRSTARRPPGLAVRRRRCRPTTRSATAPQGDRLSRRLVARPARRAAPRCC